MAISRRTFLRTTSSAVAASAVSPLLAREVQPQVESQQELALNLEMWLGEVAFTERLARAADLGFHFFEFWPWRGKDLDALEAAMRTTSMKATQFTAWGFVPGMNDPKNHDAVLKEIEASCRVANRLGVPMMTVVGGNDQPSMTAQQMHANITEALKRGRAAHLPRGG